MDYMKNVYHITIDNWGNIYPKLINKKLEVLNVTKLQTSDEYKNIFNGNIPYGMYLISDSYIIILWGKDKFYKLSPDKRCSINKVLLNVL